MPTISQLKKRIEKNSLKIRDLKNKVEQDSRELLRCSMLEIFKKNKSFESFSWTQYTPYWNDGDTCEFYAHTDSIFIDDEEESVCSYELKSLYEKLLEKDKEIKKLQRRNNKLEKNNDIKNWEYSSNKRQIEILENSNIDDVKRKLDFLLDIEELVSSIDQDTLYSMFGDHCKVTVKKDGVTTESWSHD